MKIREFLLHDDNCSAIIMNYRLKKKRVSPVEDEVPKVIFRCEKETRN